MQKTGLPTVLRWIFFVLGIGTMISAGIYLKAYVAGGTVLGGASRSHVLSTRALLHTHVWGEQASPGRRDLELTTSSFGLE